ncbi:CHAD domain-containing protein [Candidatus Accumulibacter sp. ACC003]|uniref:CYTH and CHAD domain-containing protein n=1 Tax=Candidatus Accumulibacter sp. ACC003 TaxID=2823334 RepID=UPI0025BFD575|nr:CHAD domain-containing protein [Candidatus Accumulibacter sp. ACC003]
MDIGRELALSLTPGAAGRLLKHPLLSEAGAIRERVIIDTCFDTADLRLQRAQLVVRQRHDGASGQGWVSISSGELSANEDSPGARWQVAGEPGDFDFSDVSDSALREWLEALRDDLQAAFTCRFTRSACLLEPRPGVRIELALDRGRILGGGRQQAICELRLEVLAGSAGDLFAAASVLQRDFSLHPLALGKQQRGYRLLAEEVPPAVKAIAVRTDAEMSASSAFRRIALACLGQLQGNEQGVRESDDPEFIHQARIAIHRLRAALRIWRPLLPVAFVNRFDAQWQALDEQLGEARNWDVFRVETLPRIALALPAGGENGRLSNYAQRRCALNREAARSALQSDDYSRLLLEFTAGVLALGETDERRLDAFALTCLDKAAKQVSQLAGEALLGAAAARHRLRIAYKRLRYALEFFAALFPGELLRNYHLSVSGLQDVLGRLNDLAVAAQLSEEVLPGEPGSAIRSWLKAQGEALLPELRGWLNDFRRYPAPWRSQQ